MSGDVYSVAVQADGRILFGGGFTTVGGTARNCIARVDAAGTLDAGFNPNVDSFVYSVAVQADGRILLGGLFSGVGGTARNRIARVDAAGALDAGFNPNVDGVVLSVAVQTDGRILLGGNFTTVGGTARNRIARVDAAGTLDAGFNPNANNNVESVAVQADGRILLGGYFSSVGGTARNLFARLLNDAATQTLSAPDATQLTWTRGGSSPEVSLVTFEKTTDSGATWTPLGSGTRIGTTANWQLTGLSLSGSGQLRARGRTTNGYSNGGSGLVEATASYSFSGVAPGDVDSLDAAVVGNFVLATAVQPDGKTIIAGLFTSVLGQPRNRIARLNADGTLDAGFNPDANNYVFSVAVQADGRILLGGGFTTVGGTARNRIARVDAAGALDAGFNPNANNDVYSVAVQADGRILLGGEFATMGGSARNLFARLLNDPATQTLGAPDATQVTWARGGSSPEVSLVAFEKSIDGGTNWTPLGSGTRVGTTANWQLTGLALPGTGQIRARGRTSGGYFNSSSGLVEAVASYSFGPQDMTAPETTITSGPSGTVNSPSATFTYGADEASTFTYSLDGGAPATGAGPVTFNALGNGAHTFSVFATDTAGNVDATPATRTWTVQLDPLTTVAFHGATAGATPSPGDVVPGEPVGTTFRTFGIPALNDAGAVAFLTTMTTPTGSVVAIFDGTAVVARKAAATPIAGTTFASFKDPALNSQGEVAFLAGLAGSVATLDKTALFTNDGGTLATVVRTDDALPGLGGARLNTISAFQLLDDAVLFSGLLQSKTAGVAPGPGGATTANDFILCRWTASSGVELLLREGASLGGKTVKTISTLLPASGSTGHGRKGNPNASGLARVGFTDGTYALMEIDPAGVTVLAETGGTLTNPAGAQWNIFGLPATSRSGGAAFLATLAVGPGGVTSANATGLFADMTASDATLVARKGDTVGGFTLTGFKDPVFNDDSAVASLVTLGGAVTSATNKAILLVPDGGAATLIAQTGSEPAGVAGAQWKAFSSLALPDGLGTVFTAAMVSGASGTAGPGGVTTATDTGLWAQDSNGALHLIAREGVTVIEGKTLKSFTALGAVPGSPGQTRVFNANKQLVYRATYTDNSQSLVTVQMP